MKRCKGLNVKKETRTDDCTHSLPVVVFTGCAAKGDIKAAYAFGANSFVQKPLDFQHFVNTVQALGHYWLETNVASEIVVEAAARAAAGA